MTVREICMHRNMSSIEMDPGKYRLHLTLWMFLSGMMRCAPHFGFFATNTQRLSVGLKKRRIGGERSSQSGTYTVFFPEVGFYKMWQLNARLSPRHPPLLLYAMGQNDNDICVYYDNNHWISICNKLINFANFSYLVGWKERASKICLHLDKGNVTTIRLERFILSIFMLIN